MNNTPLRHVEAAARCTAIVQIHRCLRRFVSDRESTRINANKEGSNSLQKTKLRESFQANDLTFLLLIIRVNSRQFAVVPSVAAEPRWVICSQNFGCGRAALGNPRFS